MFKKILPLAILCLSLSGCLDSDGDVAGSSTSNVLASNVGAGTLPSNVVLGDTDQLPAPMDGSTCAAAGNILEWDGSAWQCVPPAAVSSVAAGNVTAGTFGAGVLLPGSQITGPIGLANLPADLDGAGCAAAGHILEWTGSAWDCVAPSSGAVAASAVTAGTFGAGVILPAANIGAGALPTNVTIDIASLPADLNGAGCADDEILIWDAAGSAWGCEAPGSTAAAAVTAGTFGAGVLLPAANIAAGALPVNVDVSLASLPADLDGAGCAADQILEWDGSAWACVDHVAVAVQSVADPTALPGPTAGDIAFNSVSGELEYYDGTAWVSTASTGGDDMGDHTATQDLDMDGNGIVGATSACDADEDTCVYMEKAADEDYVRIDTNGVERVTVTPTGFVGVGTDTPLFSLHVAGNNKAQLGGDNTDLGRLLLSDGSGFSSIAGLNGGLAFSNVSAAEISPHMILIEEDLGLGTITPEVNFHISATGQVYGRAETADANWAGFQVVNTGAGGGFATYGIDPGGNVAIRNNTGTGPLTPFRAELATGNVSLNGAAGFAHPITAAGGARLTAAFVWTDGSDFKLKKNINDLSKYGLDTVLKLEPKEYKMKDSDIDQIGFIAQDIQKLVPEVVSEGETLSMSYGQLSVIYVNAIKELHAENESLKERLERLENIVMEMAK